MMKGMIESGARNGIRESFIVYREVFISAQSSASSQNTNVRAPPDEILE